ncbi:MAG: DNA repair protein RecO [Chlamydiota bacterium]
MTSSEQVATLGITLRSYPFRDTSQIVKVYTKEYGLISLLIKGITSKNSQKISLSSSFTFAEFYFKKGKNDLHYFTEGKILDLHLPLRKSLERIQAGTKICQAVLKMQEPEKKNELLFSLLTRFIKKIETSTKPLNYLYSFRMKSLLLEGLMHMSFYCSHCKAPVSYIYLGECFCQEHAPCNATLFSSEELACLFQLSYTKSFAEMEKTDVSKKLEEKMEALYQDLIKN